ncbi:hypothetical protein [Chrysodeixis includens nucleopolyhedrovirus]|uniref:Ac34 n=1 Tax=Chrysodeixis includens nucleopolyhedrovirus TaxID=1207438 RepID=A0A1C8ZXQ0_9ABAC|nr:hypothetical protein [Chrysodeixis includens nucleopolyhedrovirus]AOL56604.1 hypothetical protein [Chrysodeixis includens nucleopolyhedrovirus]AOL56745.1 hypothetical protein [Chrysodeixis includens nucleopolyhedrovirus]AOL56887.1 hypothetical protein [Chrysodeixis includens nucleopolyhedrovirus]
MKTTYIILVFKDLNYHIVSLRLYYCRALTDNEMNQNETFRDDLRRLTSKLMDLVRPKTPKVTTTLALTSSSSSPPPPPPPPPMPSPPPKLGDVLQHMGRNKLLLKRKKDDDFSIEEINILSDEARDYLNALQLEKFYHCRLCYHKNAELRCDFHRKYVFDQSSDAKNSAYIEFLNSEMGVISFVELYYSYLSVPFWKLNAQFLFRDLTGFSSIKELLTFYNYECLDDVDDVSFETMDEEDEETASK